jgi:rare lipoprotein A
MRRGATIRYAILLLAGASLAACATVHPEYAAREPGHRARPPASPGYKIGSPYQVGGVWYVPKAQPDYDQTGVASWYGDAFHLKPTANGEIFDKEIPSAAHTTLPLPSLVEVTNLDNGRRLVVRVNDRGPFVDNRIIDLSHEAARQLGYERQGLAHVRVRYLGPAPIYGEESRRYAYLAPKPAVPAAAPPPAPPRREPEVVLTSAPPPKVREIILEASLAPLPKPPSAVAEPMASAPPAAAPKIEVASAFRVQAGAFSTPENARRAVAQLASAGMARVEPMARGGTTLYRVMLDGAADQDSAEVLREKVAEAGFTDARVIRPF